MRGAILAFTRRERARPLTRDWSQQELAEFYRVEAALIKAGLAVETERGLTDEGDPWFVFCRAEDGEVVIHFARLGEEYVVAGLINGESARGRDFSALARAIVSSHPVARPARDSGNVIMHPASMLVALVGVALLKAGEAKAMSGDDSQRSGPSAAAAAAAGHPAPHQSATHFSAMIDAAQVAAIVAAAGFVASLAADALQGRIDLARPSQAAIKTASAEVSPTKQAHEAATPDGDGSHRHAANIDQAALAVDDAAQTMVAPTAADLQAGAAHGLSAAELLKLLSFISVLWTLPGADAGHAQGEISPAAAAALLGLGADSRRADASALSHDEAGETPAASAHADAKARAEDAPPTKAAPGPTPGADSGHAETTSKALMSIEVAKSSAGLPDVVAVKMALVDISDAHLVKLSALPTALLKIIEVEETSSAAPHAPGATLIADWLSAEPPVGGWPAAPSPAARPEPIITVSSPNGVTHYVSPEADASVVQKAVDMFKIDTPAYKIALKGGDIIFYDEHAVLSRPADLKSETWTFSDGSSISLVGVGLHAPAELV